MTFEYLKLQIVKIDKLNPFEKVMNHTPPVKHTIPLSSQKFRLSRAASSLLVATLLLGLLLVVSTLQNINRAETLMAQFLLDKGETIIRSLEAGSRTTMMHHMGSGNPLHTLLAEYTKDKSIRYIFFLSEDGGIIEHVGTQEELPISVTEIAHVKATGLPITKRNPNKGTFILSKNFKINTEETQQHAERHPPFQLNPKLSENFIISLGLRTEQFDIARKQDVRHTMFMGAILFLVSSAGLYFLFLYQKVRTVSSNLSDMKLYTDSIIESIPVSLVTLDANDTIVSCNKNTEDVTGLSAPELIGTPISSILSNHPDVIADICDSMFEHETDLKDKGGKQIPLKISCAPLVSHTEEQIGKVLILRDMSLLKSMQLQLEMSRRMAALGKMAAGIAHEIRNPLGTLRGFVQFFENDPETAETRKKYSKLMLTEIDRLNKTVSGLLQFSRPRELQLQDIDIQQLLEKTVSLMQADIKSKEVRLSYKAEPGQKILADPDLLLQVLINLLKNSINATPVSGSISLEAFTDSGMHKISVIDSGEGMSHTDREKMFDPFFTTTKTGTGLGLAVSHQIIEQHSGSFEVLTQPNHGTIVTICLPQQGKVQL